MVIAIVVILVLVGLLLVFKLVNRGIKTLNEVYEERLKPIKKSVTKKERVIGTHWLIEEWIMSARVVREYDGMMPQLVDRQGDRNKCRRGIRKYKKNNG